MRRLIYWSRDDRTFPATLTKHVRLIQSKKKIRGYHCLELQRRIDARKRDKAA